MRHLKVLFISLLAVYVTSAAKPSPDNADAVMQDDTHDVAMASFTDKKDAAAVRDVGSGTKRIASTPSGATNQKNSNADFNVEEMRASRIAANSAAPPMPPAAQVTGCRTQGQIAMTFSEGPSDATAKIARHLNNAKARANFFVNATWLYTQQYAMVLQNVYNAGHLIGMMYRPKGDDSSAMTDEELRADIINNARTIQTLINVSPKYVRLHYTKNEDLRTEKAMRDLGFVIVGYNLDSQDYSHKSPSGPDSVDDVYRSTFRRQKDTYDAKGSFISIQYDIPDTGTLAAIPYVVNTIQDEGYTMVRLDGCLNDKQPYKKNADTGEYVGDKFSFGSPDYHQGQTPVPPPPIEARTDDDLGDMGIRKDSGAYMTSGHYLLPFIMSFFAFVVYHLF